MDDICEACGEDTNEIDLVWDEEYECYVCPDCEENPPE